MLCLTYQCVHKTAPQYLQELFPNTIHTVLFSPLPCVDWASLDFARTQTKNVQEQSHSAMLHPPSGTGCQTTSTKQKTLPPFGGSWNHIFNFVILSSPHPRLLPLIVNPPPPFPFPPSLPSAMSMWFPAWIQNVFYKWTLTLTLNLWGWQHVQSVTSGSNPAKSMCDCFHSHCQAGVWDLTGCNVFANGGCASPKS